MHQLTDGPDKILIAVVDETYPTSSDDEWDHHREIFRRELERDFGLAFESGNIGAGADIPAFLTLLQSSDVPNWVIGFAAFFLGEPVSKNLAAWKGMAAKVRSFFKRRSVFVSRQGAALLAVEAVFEDMGGLPKSLTLLSYRVEHVLDPKELSTLDRSETISEPPSTISLGHTQHVFEIDADGIAFRVGVEGKTVKLIRLT